MAESFVFYKSFMDAVQGLSPEVRCEAYEAIMTYAFTGEEPEMSQIARIVFTMARPQLDANKDRRKNAKKGGEAKRDKAKQKAESESAYGTEDVVPMAEKDSAYGTQDAVPNVNVNANVNENDNGNVKKERVAKATPKKSETPEAFLESVTETPEVMERLKRFIAMRKQIKKPLSGYAMKLAYGELLKISDDPDMKCKIIDQSLMHSWQTFYPLKNEVARSGTINFSNERKYDPSIEALLLGES